MKAFLIGLGGDVLFLVSVAAIFGATALVSYLILLQFREFLASYRETFTESASANMSDMFLFIDVQKLFLIQVAAVIVLPPLLWFMTGDLISALILLGLLIIAPGLFYRSMRKKRLRKFESQLPDALMMVSGAMRAGASLNIAVENLVKEQPPPVSQEFELFLREQRLGLDFERSLDNMEKRVPIQEFVMVSSALKISREVGGNLAETLESLGETLRRKGMMEGKIGSLTAQGKLQGIVMTGLPFLLAIGLYFLERESMEKLWTTVPGYITLGFVIVWLALGNFFIRKITAIDV